MSKMKSSPGELFAPKFSQGMEVPSIDFVSPKIDLTVFFDVSQFATKSPALIGSIRARTRTTCLKREKRNSAWHG